MNYKQMSMAFSNQGQFWNTLASAPGSFGVVSRGAGLAAAGATIGITAGVGLSGMGSMSNVILPALVAAAAIFVGSLVFWVVFANIISRQALGYGGDPDELQSHKLAAGALVPFWAAASINYLLTPLAGVLPLPLLVTSNLMTSVAGLVWGFILLKKGLPIVNGTPAEKSGRFALVALVYTNGVFMVLGLMILVTGLKAGLIK